MACKGICIRYKAKHKGAGFRYAKGQKRCNYCGVFMMWDGRKCPCCGYTLRTKPRFRVYKERLRTQTLMQNISSKEKRSQSETRML